MPSIRAVIRSAVVKVPHMQSGQFLQLLDFKSLSLVKYLKALIVKLLKGSPASVTEFSVIIKCKNIKYS